MLPEQATILFEFSEKCPAGMIALKAVAET